jgi:3-methyladenine DNA glycosylase/8-oxoguanine DNA glycosylase
VAALTEDIGSEDSYPIYTWRRRRRRSARKKRRVSATTRTKAVRHLGSADATLANLIELAGPFTLQIRHLHNPFEALARNIIYQQLHGKAAAAIHGRVLALFGKKKLHPQDVLSAPGEGLRGAGLSAAKLAALRDLSAKTLDGTVPTLARLRRMNDDEIVERLTAVRGIGRWTVEMLLMFRLGRPDVLPVGMSRRSLRSWSGTQRYGDLTDRWRVGTCGARWNCPLIVSRIEVKQVD